MVMVVYQIYTDGDVDDDDDDDDDNDGGDGGGGGGDGSDGGDVDVQVRMVVMIIYERFAFRYIRCQQI